MATYVHNVIVVPVAPIGDRGAAADGKALVAHAAVKLPQPPPQVAPLPHPGVTRAHVARLLPVDLAEPRVGAAKGGEGMANVPDVLHHGIDLRRLGLVPAHQPELAPDEA